MRTRYSNIIYSNLFILLGLILMRFLIPILSSPLYGGPLGFVFSNIIIFVWGIFSVFAAAKGFIFIKSSKPQIRKFLFLLPVVICAMNLLIGSLLIVSEISLTASGTLFSEYKNRLWIKEISENSGRE